MDKHGEKWVVGIGSILLGVSVLIASAITSYVLLLLCLILVGIWYGPAQPGGSSAIVKWFPKERRGLAMGIRQTGIPLGGAFASALLPVVFYRYGLSEAMLVQAAVAIIGGILFLIFYKDKKVDHSSGKRITFHEKVTKIKNNFALYPVFFIGISMMSLQLVIVAHLMSYLTNTINVTLSTAGMFLSVALIGGMIGRVVLAWISDQLFNANRSKPLLLTICLTIVIVQCLVFLPSFIPLWVIGPLCFMLGFLGIGWYSLFIVLVSEKADSRFIGLTVSFALTLNQIFIVLAPSLFGLMVDFFSGYTLPFVLLSLFILIGGAWLKFTEQ